MKMGMGKGTEEKKKKKNWSWGPWGGPRGEAGRKRGGHDKGEWALSRCLSLLT